MKLVRPILFLTLALAVAGGAFAQESTATATGSADATTTQPAADTAGETSPHTSQETRERFNTILRQHPPELSTILSLDPTLLSNEAFLAGYPDLARFVAEYPEVRRSPRYFLGNYDPEPEPGGLLGKALEGFFVLSIFVFIAFFLAWLVRAVIEQKRWNRLSRTQTEVHNKILDRFGSSEELLAYVRTPAGTKFLESAPIPLHAEPAVSAPVSRILWSIQVGIVVMAGSIGLMIVSGRFDQETAQGMFAMGTIAFCVGTGFIAAALVSMAMSRRFGLWPGGGAAPGEAAGDAGPVR